MLGILAKRPCEPLNRCYILCQLRSAGKFRFEKSEIGASSTERMRYTIQKQQGQENFIKIRDIF